MKGIIYSALAIVGVATVAYNWKAIQETAANKRNAKKSYEDHKASQKLLAN